VRITRGHDESRASSSRHHLRKDSSCCRFDMTSQERGGRDRLHLGDAADGGIAGRRIAPERRDGPAALEAMCHSLAPSSAPCFWARPTTVAPAARVADRRNWRLRPDDRLPRDGAHAGRRCAHGDPRLGLTLGARPRAPAEEHDLHRVEEDPEVECERQALDVIEVVPDLLRLFLEPARIAVLDLGPAGESRADDRAQRKYGIVSRKASYFDTRCGAAPPGFMSPRRMLMNCGSSSSRTAAATFPRVSPDRSGHASSRRRRRPCDASCGT